MEPPTRFYVTSAPMDWVCSDRLLVKVLIHKSRFPLVPDHADEPIPPVLMPRCHIFYKRRLCDVADALPKYDEYCPIPPGYTE